MSAFRRTVYDKNYEAPRSRTSRQVFHDGPYSDENNSKRTASMNPSQSHRRLERDIQKKPSRRLTFAGVVVGAFLGRKLSNGDKLWSIAGATIGAAAVRDMDGARGKKD